MRDFNSSANTMTQRPKGLKVKVLEDTPGNWSWGDPGDYLKTVSEKFEVQVD